MNLDTKATLGGLGRCFDAGQYISGGRVQRQKFIKTHNDLSVQESEAIVLKIPEMLEAKREIERKYNFRGH